MKTQFKKVALLVTDTQGSILLQHDGESHQAQPYCAYGYTPDDPERSVLGFNSQRLEPQGYYLLGNGYRAFHPTLMRFGSPDTLSPFSSGGINAYAYCQADPVNRNDPDGHMMRRIRALFGREQSALPATSATVSSQPIIDITSQDELNAARPPGLPSYFGGREGPPPYSVAPAPNPRTLPDPTGAPTSYTPTPQRGEVILEFRNGVHIEVESLVAFSDANQIISNSRAGTGFNQLLVATRQVERLKSGKPMQTDNGILEAVGNGRAISRARSHVRDTR